MRAETILRALIAAVAVLGAAIAAYLTVVHFQGAAPVCFAGEHSGCSTVAKSEYSKLMGVPVALFGLATYLLIAASVLRRDEWGQMLGLALALIGFGFSGYLTYLELFVIHAICQWCVASAVVMTALLGLCAARAWFGAAD